MGLNTWQHAWRCAGATRLHMHKESPHIAYPAGVVHPGTVTLKPWLRSSGSSARTDGCAWGREWETEQGAAECPAGPGSGHGKQTGGGPWVFRGGITRQCRRVGSRTWMSESPIASLVWICQWIRFYSRDACRLCTRYVTEAIPPVGSLFLPGVPSSHPWAPRRRVPPQVAYDDHARSDLRPARLWTA